MTSIAMKAPGNVKILITERIRSDRTIENPQYSRLVRNALYTKNATGTLATARAAMSKLPLARAHRLTSESSSVMRSG